jgi:hypothetical protein
MTLGSPASMIETHELVVPKSIPIILLILFTSIFKFGAVCDEPPLGFIVRL